MRGIGGLNGTGRGAPGEIRAMRFASLLEHHESGALCQVEVAEIVLGAGERPAVAAVALWGLLDCVAVSLGSG